MTIQELSTQAQDERRPIEERREALRLMASMRDESQGIVASIKDEEIGLVAAGLTMWPEGLAPLPIRETLACVREGLERRKARVHGFVHRRQLWT